MPDDCKPRDAIVEVADRALEEQSADAAQDGIAKVLMQPWHGAGRDAALEPVAHDELGAPAQLRHEWTQVGKVVAVVGVAHDHVTATGGANSGLQRSAVAALRYAQHARAVRCRDLA
jgi:hypothetical protein